MWLLRHQDGSGRVVLFGAGLIGSELIQALKRQGAAVLVQADWRWDADADRVGQLNQASRLLAGDDRIDVIWSAGRAGFGADETTCAAEMENFHDIVECCARMRTIRPDRQVILHLVSSAGGIYEGSGEVGPRTRAAPRRPYGELKLKQEEWARSRLGANAIATYRPSAVYGWSRRGRRGLPMTLLANGLGYRVTSIVGSPEICRDFLWVRDLADWMVRGLRDPTRLGRAWILAAGRSQSISEVLRAVEQALGRRLYVQYRIDPSEPPRLGYLPSVIAPGMTSHSLSTALRSMRMDALGGG